MKESVSAIDLGSQLLPILGLEDKKVQSISIEMTAGGLVYVSVGLIMNVEEAGGLVKVIRQYTLEETDITPSIENHYKDTIPETLNK